MFQVSICSGAFSLNFASLKFASEQENLYLRFAKNKGTDQPAFPCSLISAFVIHLLESIIFRLSFVMYNFDVATFPLVSWVMCGA